MSLMIKMINQLDVMPYTTVMTDILALDNLQWTYSVTFAPDIERGIQIN